MIGIVGYGVYLPRYRIRTEAIARQWGKDPVTVMQGLALREKTVPGQDEDTITISVAAGQYALDRGRLGADQIGALYVGSESHPYAVKPSGTVVATALGASTEIHIADFEFACKAGTEAMFCAYSHVKSEQMDYAMAIGADTSQGAPGDALEYSASAGGAAFVMGRGSGVLAEILATHSYTSDTPDFWRREGRHYPSHGGRFTGTPAYFHHVLTSARAILDKTGMRPDQMRYVILHMPNGKFPKIAAETLGFTQDQLAPGYLVPEMGNTYSGSSPTGLAAALDVAEPGDNILVTSFGSGAGSDSFILRCTDALPQAQPRAPLVRTQLASATVQLDYAQYAKYRQKYLLNH